MSKWASVFRPAQFGWTVCWAPERTNPTAAFRADPQRISCKPTSRISGRPLRFPADSVSRFAPGPTFPIPSPCAICSPYALSSVHHHPTLVHSYPTGQGRYRGHQSSNAGKRILFGLVSPSLPTAAAEFHRHACQLCSKPFAQYQAGSSGEPTQLHASHSSPLWSLPPSPALHPPRRSPVQSISFRDINRKVGFGTHPALPGMRISPTAPSSI